MFVAKERPAFAEHCVYCGRRVRQGKHLSPEPTDATADHVKPKSMLVRGELEHVVTSCRTCNTMKSDTPPNVFRAYIKLFGYRGLNNARAYRVFCYELMTAGLQDQDNIAARLVDRWPVLWLALKGNV